MPLLLPHASLTNVLSHLCQFCTTPHDWLFNCYLSDSSATRCWLSRLRTCATMGMLVLQCSVRTIVMLLLLFRVSCTDVNDAMNVGAADGSTLTFRLSYVTCHTDSLHDTTHSPHPQPARLLPRCTLSIRVLRHSHHPTWHAVHNQSVTAATSSFIYHIPSTHIRCHHQVVLRCVSNQSNDPLPVVPSAGFFHSPIVAGQPPVDTFIILDNTSCRATSSYETVPTIRRYGFCLPADKLFVPAAVTSTTPQQPIRNLSHQHFCPIQSSPLAGSINATQLYPRPRLSRLPTVGQKVSLSTQVLVWLYEQARSTRAERGNHWQSHDSGLEGGQNEVAKRALRLFRSWLLLLSGAGLCSAAVLVYLIARLTKRIET